MKQALQLSTNEIKCMATAPHGVQQPPSSIVQPQGQDAEPPPSLTTTNGVGTTTPPLGLDALSCYSVNPPSCATYDNPSL